VKENEHLKELKAKEDENISLRDKITVKENENLSLKDKLKEKENELTSKENENLSQKDEHKVKENEHLKELKAKEDEILSLKNELKEKEDQNSSLKKVLQTKEGEHSSLKTSENILMSKVQVLQTHKDLTRIDHNEKESSMELKQQILLRDSTIDDLNGKIDKHEQNILNLNSTILEKTTDYENLQETLKMKEEYIKKLQNEKEEDQIVRNDIEQQLEQFRTYISEDVRSQAKEYDSGCIEDDGETWKEQRCSPTELTRPEDEGETETNKEKSLININRQHGFFSILRHILFPPSYSFIFAIIGAVTAVVVFEKTRKK